MTDHLIPIPEAARRLGVDRKRIMLLISKGYLTPVTHASPDLSPRVLLSEVNGLRIKLIDLANSFVDQLPSVHPK